MVPGGTAGAQTAAYECLSFADVQQTGSLHLYFDDMSTETAVKMLDDMIPSLRPKAQLTSEAAPTEPESPWPSILGVDVEVPENIKQLFWMRPQSGTVNGIQYRKDTRIDLYRDHPELRGRVDTAYRQMCRDFHAKRSSLLHCPTTKPHDTTQHRFAPTSDADRPGKFSKPASSHSRSLNYAASLGTPPQRCLDGTVSSPSEPPSLPEPSKVASNAIDPRLLLPHDYPALGAQQHSETSASASMELQNTAASALVAAGPTFDTVDTDEQSERVAKRRKRMEERPLCLKDSRVIVTDPSRTKNNGLLCTRCCTAIKSAQGDRDRISLEFYDMLLPSQQDQYAETAAELRRLQNVAATSNAQPVALVQNIANNDSTT